MVKLPQPWTADGSPVPVGGATPTDPVAPVGSAAPVGGAVPSGDAGRAALPFTCHHAFIIGIDAYQNVTPLHTAVNDARAVARVLADSQHFLVHPPLLDASGAAIRELLETTLPREVGPDDRVFFYFAGHGTLHLDDHGNSAGYLVPMDAVQRDKDSEHIETLIPMAELHAALEKLKCRHLLLVLDCCFAGAFEWSSNTRDIGGLPNTIYKERFDRYVLDRAWQVITSAAYDQKALDLIQGHPTGARGLVNTEDGRAHSPFAQALFEGIAGAADLKGPNQGNGIITATELYSYIRDQVEPASIEEGEREGQQLRQTPGFFTLGNHDKGEYIFLDPNNRLNLPPIPDRSPYKRLASFEEEDQALFYGRERVVDELLSKHADHSLLVITGASGTGKSSLLKAGLLPVLRAQGCRILSVLRPGEHPLAELEQLIEEARGPESASTPEQELASANTTAPAPAFAPVKKCILIIDQYEEMIARCADEAERGAVAERLCKLLDEDKSFQVILTVRSDFEPRLSGGALKEYWAAGLYPVPEFPEIRPEELREIILKPTTQEVLFFDPPNLVDDIVAGVLGARGALPLLSYVLSEFYEAYRTSGRQDRALKREDYDKFGGIIGALRTLADNLYDGLEKGEKDTLRKIMLRMVSVKGDLADKSATMEDLHFSDAEAPIVAKVIDLLVKARLVVRYDDPVTHADSVMPAHAALVHAWKQLRDWIFEVGMERLMLGAKLSEAALDYAKKQDANSLWSANPKLPVARTELGNARRCLLNSREADFIYRSMRRRKRRKLFARIGAAVIIVALAAAAWIAEQDKIAAERASANARARSLEFASHSQRAVDYDAALLLALEAARVEKLPEIQKLIDEELDVPGQLLAKLVDPEMNESRNKWTVAAWEPTGEHIATVSLRNNMIRVWDAKSHSLTGRCEAKGAFVVWSPHGRFFAVGGRGERSKVFDSKTLGIGSKACSGVEFSQVPMRGGSMHAAWSPDGQCLVTQGGHGFDVSALKSTGEWHTVFVSDTSSVAESTYRQAEWDSAGRRLLTVSMHGEARMWDLPICGPTTEDGARPIKGRLIAASGRPGVLAAAWSPQGDRLLMTLADHTVSIQDAASGRELRRLRDNHGSLTGAAWDPDGKRIVTATDDDLAKIWNVSTGESIMNLSGHVGEVTFARWSPDGKILVTAGEDHSVRTWTAETGKQRAVLMHQGLVNSVDWSTDGLLVTASSDGFAGIWDPEMPAWPPRVEFAKQRLQSVYSPDQTQILSTGNRDGKAIVWDAHSGKILFELHPPKQAFAHAGGARGGGWNTRGNRIVTAGGDGMVRIWDAAMHQLAFEFRAVDQRDVKEADEKASLDTPLWDPHGDPEDHSGDRLLTRGNDSHVKIWRIGDAGLIGSPTVFDSNGDVLSASWSADGKRVLVTSSAEPYATLWDPERGIHRPLSGLTNPVLNPVWSPDGRWLAVSGDHGKVTIYPSAGGDPPVGFARVAGSRFGRGYRVEPPQYPARDRRRGQDVADLEHRWRQAAGVSGVWRKYQ